MMKLKRIQNLEMQKSGRKIKSPVASKKKPSKWCMCMRGKAPVANKESEEGSEDDPLQNSFYNQSNNVSDRDVHSSLNREKRREPSPVKKVDNPPPKANKVERKKTASVPSEIEKPLITGTPVDTEQVDVSRQDSKTMKDAPSQEKFARKLSIANEDQ